MGNEQTPKNEVEVKTTTTIEEKRDAREFILNKDVNAESIENIIMSIFEINRIDEEKESKDDKHVREPIKIIVNTYGGSIYDGFALCGAIDTSVTPIYTYCYGKAMSMGFLIFAFGHKRFAHPLATFMYHQGSGGIHDKFEGIGDYCKQADVLNNMYDEYVVSLTKIEKKKLKKVQREKRDWYIRTKEAVELGLVDAILESKRKK